MYDWKQSSLMSALHCGTPNRQESTFSLVNMEYFQNAVARVGLSTVFHAGVSRKHSNFKLDFEINIQMVPLVFFLFSFQTAFRLNFQTGCQ